MNVLMPQLGETVTEGTIAVWHKKVGDTVGPDDILFDVETDKASMEVPAQAAGVLKEIRFEAGQTVDVGTVVAVIDDGKGASAGTGAGGATAAAGSPPAAQASSGAAAAAGAGSAPRADAGATVTAIGAVERSGNMRLSPAVRRLAAEHQIDLAAISGSGRNGRITRRNVLEFIAVRRTGTQAAATASAPAAP